MKIKWNEVTPFSKWAALIVFLLVLPVLTFYIGMKYNETRNALYIGALNQKTADVVPVPSSTEPEVTPMPEAVSQEELQTLFQGAREYVVKNSALGNNFELTLSKYTFNEVIFDVTDRLFNTGWASLVMRRIMEGRNDGWEVAIMSVGNTYAINLLYPRLFDGYYSYSYADYNFDGLIDRIGMDPKLCGATGNCPYFVEFYDPAIKGFRDPKGGSYEPFGDDLRLVEGSFMPTNPEVNQKEKIVCEYIDEGTSGYNVLFHEYSDEYFIPKKQIEMEFNSESKKFEKKMYTFDTKNKKRILQSSSILPLDTEISHAPCTLAQ